MSLGYTWNGRSLPWYYSAVKLSIFTRFKVEMLVRSGLNKYVAGDYTGAEEAFQAVLELQPSRPGIHHHLALVWAARGDFERAEPLLLKELEDFGEHYPRLRVLGDLYYQWGKRDEAVAMYTRALAEECPDSDRMYITERIAVAGDPLRFKDALKSRDTLLEGNRLLESGNHEEAARMFQQAVEFDRTNVSGWNNLGVVYLDHLNVPGEAVAAFHKALELQDVPWIRSNLNKAETRLKWESRKK